MYEVEKLIEPVKSGKELIAEIDSASPGNGVAIWWLGQSGYVIKTKETTIYIDIYLSEFLTAKWKDMPNPHNRMTRAPFRGEDIFNADLAISSHRHADHMDPQTMPQLLKNCPDAKYIIPTAYKEHVTSWGIDEDRLILAKVDQEIPFRDVVIIPQPAKHEKFDYTEEQDYPHMSFIIKTGGVTLYHSGDTLPYYRLVQRLEKHGVDVLLLPINGRDMRRHSYGTPGNFTMEESLSFAELYGAKLLIPHHYEMFTFNTVDIELFKETAAEFYPDVNCCVLKCGEMKVIE